MRDVDLSPDLAQRLRKHVTEVGEKALRSQWGEPELLFPSRVNTPLQHDNVARVYRRVLKHAELPYFRVYDLRHTYASALLSEGAPVAYVSAQLGHSKPDTTFRHYTKWIPRDGHNYASLLDQNPGKSSIVFHNTRGSS